MTRAMGGLAGFVNGLAQGYGTVMRFQREADDDEERRKDRAFVSGQRDRTLKQQQEDDALKDDVKAAAAPVKVESGEVYQPSVDDEGNAMPANPTAGSFAVKGVRFADKAAAQNEADAQGASAAVYDRVAEAYKKAGRMDLYEAHRRLATQARDEGAAEFADAIRSGSPALADIQATRAGFVSQALPPEAIKNFNGMGKWKLPADTVAQAFVSKDATGADAVDHRLVRPDGTVLVGSLNDATNYLGLDAGQRRAARKDDARLGLDVKRTDATIAHQAGVLQLQQRTAADTAAYHRGMLGVAQQNANTQEAWRRDSAQTNRDKVAAKGGSQAAPAPAITTKDLRDFDHDLLSALGPQFAVKEGTSPDERTALNNQLTATRAQAQGIFRANAELGQVLPASVVLQAHTLGQDPKNRRVAEVGGQRYPVVVVNGQPVIVGPGAAPAPAAAPAAGGAAQPMPAAAAAAGVRLGSPAGAAAPAQAQAPAPAAQAAAPLDAIFGAGSITGANVASVAGSLKALQADLKAAIDRKASPQELSGHAQAVQAARDALMQQMKTLQPEQQAQVLQILGIS